MILELTQLPTERVRGIYTIGGVAGRMPARALYLHPLAAASYLADLADALVVSDLLRTPESSLEAVRRGRGAQPPGYSLHNFGVALDLDIAPTMKRVGVATKPSLDAWMRERGWWCHRVDGKMAHEAWHYNYLRAGEQLGHGPVTISPRVRSTAGYGEELIRRLYGAQIEPDDRACQEALARLRIYRGAIDGDVGPLTREAVRVFRRGWGLPDDYRLDARTRRTLALVAAERRLVPVP